MLRAGSGFITREEGRSDLYGFGAERECCHHASGIGNAAGCDHGSSNGIDHLRNERNSSG